MNEREVVVYFQADFETQIYRKSRGRYLPCYVDRQFTV